MGTFNAKLTIVHVWRAPDSRIGALRSMDPEGTRRSQDQAASMLRRLQDIVRERYSNTKSYFLTCKPCPQIVGAAQGSQVDLIVISTHDYDWLSHLLDGSDAEKILHQATCPVWIVREKESVGTRGL
jgi:nucleotide-binding universal stress UspA family protein